VTVPLRSTRVDVDLDAIVENTRAISAAAGGDAVIAVVKADAYGHGAEAVAGAALEAGAVMLAVFTVEEALLLRRAQPTAPILVLLGPSTDDEIAPAVSADLTLVVWEPERARAIAAAARAARRVAAVHFKLDSGLTRLGARPDVALRTYQVISLLEGLRIDGLFTHLASPDERVDDASEGQLARFRELLAGIAERPRFVHVAASAGVARFGALPETNAVRPGLALYGLHAAEHLAPRLALRPALRWRSAVQRVADVPRGTGVSYGHEYRMSRGGAIATVPVGYGDGLPRAAGRSGRLVVGGVALPLAGRVAMDLVMLDVTDRRVKVGDEVVIIGEQAGVRQTAEDLAAACGTINYEVVTNIRPRVPRRYLRGGKVVATKTLLDGFRWS
jgi:alanine racemase